MRGWGVIELLRDVLPEFLVPVFAVLTHLGDVAAFFVVLTLLYWFGDRRKGAYALGVVLGGLALTVGLKSLFALPRPPIELQAPIGGYPEGYGFPSGHALGSTVFWGTLAAIYEVRSRRARIAVAALAAGLVALSRVVIGVHYAPDVVVGAAVGLLYLVVVFRLANGSPGRAFLAALALSVFAVIASVGAVATPEGATCIGAVCTSRDAVALLGATTGMALAWTRLDVPDEWPSRRTGVATIAVALPVLGGAWFAGHTLAVPLVVTLLVNVATFAGILVLPTTASRVARRRGLEG